MKLSILALMTLFSIAIGHSDVAFGAGDVLNRELSTELNSAESLNSDASYPDRVSCFAKNQNGAVFKASGIRSRAKIQARAMYKCYEHPYSVQCYAQGCD